MSYESSDKLDKVKRKQYPFGLFNVEELQQTRNAEKKSYIISKIYNPETKKDTFLGTMTDLFSEKENEMTQADAKEMYKKLKAAHQIQNGTK